MITENSHELKADDLYYIYIDQLTDAKIENRPENKGARTRIYTCTDVFVSVSEV